MEKDSPHSTGITKKHRKGTFPVSCSQGSMFSIVGCWLASWLLAGCRLTHIWRRAAKMLKLSLLRLILAIEKRGVFVSIKTGVFEMLADFACFL